MSYTATVRSVLTAFLCLSCTDCRVAHNVAQLVHAVAQGKICSGFHVAAAVYGEYPLMPCCHATVVISAVSFLHCAL
jgi:phosphomevalonate kinase